MENYEINPHLSWKVTVMIQVISAETEEMVQHAITLSQEYVVWMIDAIRTQYPELDINEFTSEHNYDDVNKKFPGEHVPPYGRLFLALSGDQVGGCIALGKLSNTVCEMRTLYVRPAFRGMGIGKKLVDTLLDEAREIGYSHMRLDTLGFMDSAPRLYRSLGFQSIEPYRNVSDSLKQYICFLETDLRE
jgi:ribosomal protein S18 acetylase RimI-like enzyme